MQRTMGKLLTHNRARRYLEKWCVPACVLLRSDKRIQWDEDEPQSRGFHSYSKTGLGTVGRVKGLSPCIQPRTAL